MIHTIMGASGIQYRESHFRKPPAGTYAVYFDSVTVKGPDRTMPPTGGVLPGIYSHDVTVELYTPAPDPAAESALEAAISAQGILWTKQPRYWIQSEQIYQTIYELSYTEKRRT